MAKFHDLMIYDAKDMLQNIRSLFSYVLILVISSQILQMMEWWEMQNIIYLENGA